MKQEHKDILLYVISLVVLVVFLQTCGVKSSIRESEDIIIERLDSLSDIVYELPTTTDLTVEGLESEKRMIQATDRKLLDVQRQTEIEKEIASLKKKD
jgi:hypothetical protein